MFHGGHDQQRQPKVPEHRRQRSKSPAMETQLAPDQSGTETSCTLSKRRVTRNPEFERKLEEMALELHPLVQITTGKIHSAFPMTLLNFWLLTEDQLESLAHFYHQRTPSSWTSQYPCPVKWGPNLSLEEKRRRMGKFVGIRGCESPIALESAEEMLEEASRQAALDDEADEALKRKFGFYN